VVLERELKGTPLDGQAEHFVAAGKKYGVDALFLASIQFHESRYCGSYSKDTNDKRHNCAGIMAWNNGERYIKEYDSYEAFIYDHARIIKAVYLDDGRETIHEIWERYAPSNENMNSSWGPAVAKKYLQLRSK
jgi:beta-N-acetylglucosaminidase